MWEEKEIDTKYPCGCIKYTVYKMNVRGMVYDTISHITIDDSCDICHHGCEEGNNKCRHS